MYLHWNPDPVAFYLPFVHHPVAWYGILFAFGFAVGFYFFRLLLQRLFCFECEFKPSDVLNWNHLSKGGESRQAILKRLNEWLEKKQEGDPPPSSLLRFAKKHLCEKDFGRFRNRILIEKRLGNSVLSLKKKSRLFADQLTLYIIVGVVAGARLGHVLLYENCSYYFSNPLSILKVWKGGLASHGAVLGVLVALAFFYLRKKRVKTEIPFFRMVDLLTIPALLVGAFVRLGNFINQEVVGKATSSFLGLVFVNPAGGLPLLRRHPAQLYEALFYLLSFTLFFRLFPRLLFPLGRIAGLFFIATFLFRFLIEFIKEEQSFHLSGHALTMGQYLSVPCILLGGLFLTISHFFNAKKRGGRTD